MTDDYGELFYLIIENKILFVVLMWKMPEILMQLGRCILHKENRLWQKLEE